MATTLESIVIEFLGKSDSVDDASKKSQKSLKDLEKQGNKTGNSLNKINFKNIGVQLAIIGIVAKSSFEVGKAIGTWWQRDRMEEFLRGMEKMKELNKEIARQQGRRHAEVLDEAKFIEGGDNKRAFFDEKIDQARRDIGGLNVQVNRLKQTAEDMKPTWMSLWQSGKDGAKASEEDHKAAVERLKQRKKQLTELMEARGDTITQDERAQIKAERSAEALGQKYKMMIETFNMSSRQAEIHRMKMKGVGDEYLKTARKMDKMLTIMENNKRAREEAQRAGEQEMKRLQREREAAKEREKAEQEAIASRTKSAKDNIKAQILELTKGKEAADRFRLGLLGIVGADQDAIIQGQQFVEKLKERKEAMERFKEGFKQAQMENRDRVNNTVSSTPFDVSAVGIKTDAFASRLEAGKKSKDMDVVNRLDRLIEVVQSKQEVDFQKVDNLEQIQ